MEGSKLERGVLEQSLAPAVVAGEVVHGFKRGSAQLGCPTANVDRAAEGPVAAGLPAGVFWGLASVGGGEVHAAAVNVGWAPFYGNKEKTVEVHVIHDYGHDFYGEHIACVLLGYIRPEANFGSLEELKQAIADDIVFAKRMAETQEKAREWREKAEQWTQVPKKREEEEEEEEEEVEGGVVRHNPNDHYDGAEQLPEREVSATDHINAKLLASFDMLLAKGGFRMPQANDESDWPDEEEEK